MKLESNLVTINGYFINRDNISCISPVNPNDFRFRVVLIGTNSAIDFKYDDKETADEAHQNLIDQINGATQEKPQQFQNFFRIPSPGA